MYSKYILMCQSECEAECSTTDLVVAFCGEDLSWIRDLQGYRRIYVYTKCKQKVSLPKRVTVRSLPNIGSCDYVYLQHIIKSYDEENPPGRIEFTKGTHSLQRHCRLERRTHMWSKFALFVTQMMKRQRGFNLDEYKFSFHNSEKFPFLKSPYNYSQWCDVVFGGRLADFLFSAAQYPIFGGYFSLSNAQIHAYPVGMYKCMQSYQKAANEEVDHFIERSWGLLFTLTFTERCLEKLRRHLDARAEMRSWA